MSDDVEEWLRAKALAQERAYANCDWSGACCPPRRTIVIPPDDPEDVVPTDLSLGEDWQEREATKDYVEPDLSLLSEEEKADLENSRRAIEETQRRRFFGEETEAPRKSRKKKAAEPHAAGEDRDEGYVPNEGVSLDDFRAFMEMHAYIFTPSGAMWPAASVNSRIPPIPLFKKDGEPLLDEDGNQKKTSATAWLDKHRPVETMTWAPGEPMLISDRLISDGGWISRKGVTCFNLYRPPLIIACNGAEARRWLDHADKVFPGDAEHIVKWLAHRVQHPEQKINHALILGGNQGVGKDTLLEPVKRAIGPWNFLEVSPQQTLEPYNGFLKSVILRVNEARDLGDVDRFKFYDHMKAYTAAPPDVLRVNEKYLKAHYVFNCTGVIITSNHKADGIFLPADDRRHFVAWSDLTKEDFHESYWNVLWGWFEHGGFASIAAYLAELDISGFDPKAPPPKTPAFWDIVDAGRSPEDAELADILDDLKNPGATTLIKITAAAAGKEIEGWLKDRKNRRLIPHRLEKCGYVPLRNDFSKDGLWKIETRQVIYVNSALSTTERIRAANDLIEAAESSRTAKQERFWDR